MRIGTRLVGPFIVVASAAWAAPGDLDSSFGSGGIVSDPAMVQATAVLLQPDGRIVAGGTYAIVPGAGFLALARYESNGTPDTGFGSGGYAALVTFDSSISAATDAVLQPDGKILAVGMRQFASPPLPLGPPRILLARFDSTGALDPGFDGDGSVTTLIGSESRAAAVALQGDGRVVVVGTTTTAGVTDGLVLRYNADGSLDSSFGTGGVVISTGLAMNPRHTGVLVQPDGGIVVVGWTRTTPVVTTMLHVVRYLSDGSPDPSFGSGGLVTTTVPTTGNAIAEDVEIGPGGTLLVFGSDGTGEGGPNPRLLVARYLSDGSPDPTFGSAGISTIPPPAPNDNAIAYAGVILPDGCIVAAGRSLPPFAPSTREDVTVARLAANGLVDANFGGGAGVVTTHVDYNEDGLATAVQPDGKIIVAGEKRDSSSVETLLLMRYEGGGCGAGGSTCGDSVVSGGETCDDGNVQDGDCCSAACQLDPAGTACPSVQPCLRGMCEGTGVCEQTIPAGCKQSPPLRSSLRIALDAANPAASRLKWKWKRGDATTVVELGNPLTVTDYRLCGFDQAVPPVAAVLFDVPAPAASTCSTGPCWHALGTRGFRYIDPSRSSAGADQFLVKSGGSGKAAALAKARGPAFDPPMLPLPLPILVQLQLSNGTCLEATFSSAASIDNDDGLFKGQND